MNRRSFLLGATALAGAPFAAAREGHAMGRTPVGGRVVLHVPWSTASIDPHDLRDPLAALFAQAISDPVFALDASGQPYPTLAASMPTREAGETVVRLREGLRSAKLAVLDARDLAVSVERARSRGAFAILADLPRALQRKGDNLSVSFGAADPMHVAKALASPLVALLPHRFTPATPDGTGAFRADVSSSGLVLTRNVNAARGPAFLDAIEIAPAEDLKTSLRAFEAEQDDIGWLGMGLHDGRKGAVRFDLGRVAWVVLIVGPDGGPPATPGAAQALADAIPPGRIAHLGLGAPSSGAGDPAWTGPATELLVDEASPHLIEVARAVASVISSAGHEVTMKTMARAEIAKRRARGAATLAIELVRPLGPSLHHAQIALASAEDPARGRDVARIPLRPGAGGSARSLTGMLRVGVLGEIRVQGGAVPDLALARGPLGEGWDLGATYRKIARHA